MQDDEPRREAAKNALKLAGVFVVAGGVVCLPLDGGWGAFFRGKTPSVLVATMMDSGSMWQTGVAFLAVGGALIAAGYLLPSKP